MVNTTMHKNKNKGFSLMQFVAVVLIIILIVLLMPFASSYIEERKVEKDKATMSEIIDTIKLSLADGAVYDEVIYYSAHNNVSCYVDTIIEPTSGKTTTKTEMDLGGNGKSGPQYIFGDEARITDRSPYFAAGNMYGMTITFVPESSRGGNKTIYDLKSGIINKFANGNDAAREIAMTYVGPGPDKSTMTLGAMKNENSAKHQLYDHILDAVGDSVVIASRTYRNSEYTVFICIGGADGTDFEHHDPIEVYGQWNGTNLNSVNM